MIKRFVIMVLLMALVFGGIFGWKYYQSQRQAQASGQAAPPATVAATQVEKQNWRAYLFSVGTLIADQGLEVSSEVTGKVEAIQFQSGASVEAGDTLVQLDDSVDRARLEGLLAEERLAQLEFERAEDLLRDDTVSQATYDQALARLRNARAQIASTRALLDKKAIKAPFGGRLGVRRVNLGEYLAPGASIVTLQSLDPVHVDFSLPERHLARLSEGDAVELKVQAYGDERFRGQVSAINPKVETETRNVKLRATLANSDGRLRPGMFAEVKLLLPQRKDVLTLKQSAITYNPYGDSVFVIREKDHALVVQRRQVTTGEVRDGRVEIRNGLAAGDRVVLAGQVKLRNGQAVIIDNSAALDDQVAMP